MLLGTRAHWQPCHEKVVVGIVLLLLGYSHDTEKLSFVPPLATEVAG